MEYIGVPVRKTDEKDKETLNNKTFEQNRKGYYLSKSEAVQTVENRRWHDENIIYGGRKKS